MNKKIIFFLVINFILISYTSVFAYIGPGAGFVVATSFFFFIASFFLAILLIISYPFRTIFLFYKKLKVKKKFKQKKVVILGFDGLDPKLLKQFIDEGLMPNFKKIINQGKFTNLKTTFPSMSPVAWSSFSTGVHPGKHNIFDFLTSNRNNYIAELSSVSISSLSKRLKLLFFTWKTVKPLIKFLRKSKSFWKILGANGIFNTVIRVPITFPPEKFYGHQLSAMCTPDLLGTQGTFTFYTDDTNEKIKTTGGHIIHINKNDKLINTVIKGPDNNGTNLEIPLNIFIKNTNTIILNFNRKKIDLNKEEFSDWEEVSFTGKIKGICKFYLIQTEPVFKLYVTPINIAPDNPVMPISSPFIYSSYLANLTGNFCTLGLAEDTWALNERVTDEKIFLKQCYSIQEEREKMLYNSLEKQEEGIISCVFDGTDRIQHMFWRYLEKGHPSNKDKDTINHPDEIKKIYAHSDKVVAKTLKFLDKNDILFIMSDHGFTSFQRGVNINTFLLQNGYMKLKDDHTVCSNWFENVDWSQTSAYSLGLTGVFLNIKGREKHGILSNSKEIKKIKDEIIFKLTELHDKDYNINPIHSAHDRDVLFNGPYKKNAPDIIIGFNKKYRISWESAVGAITENIIYDNTKSWSGDHCVDPKFVPGILICNKNFTKDSPEIVDIAPTLFDLYGIKKPNYIDGENINLI